ncbi:MAG: hypothetical protein BroJett030_08320 [Alphaproteobacteria bacterium]|nr:MAG: hypothetical protein BroJett030_08320 [Alphaproteobacteria bacterium]
MPAPERLRIIACGAIAREIIAVLAANAMNHVELTCLPAILHNHPDRIPAEVEREIAEARAAGIGRIFIAYADCGTGGILDNVCEAHGVERIAGPHCYSFFTGNAAFAADADTNITAFFLTDFLARQFDAFVTRPLGLDRHPELRDAYFGNYDKLVYLAQTDDAELDRRAEAAARFLGLAYERRRTGYGDLTDAIASLR